MTAGSSKIDEGGSVKFSSGSAGISGNIAINTRTSSHNSGSVHLASGDSLENELPSNVLLSSGKSVHSGALVLTAGTSSASGQGGGVQIISGSSSIKNGGKLKINSGFSGEGVSVFINVASASSLESGAVYFGSGNNADGESGNISLESKPGSRAAGSILHQGGATSTGLTSDIILRAGKSDKKQGGSIISMSGGSPVGSSGMISVQTDLGSTATGEVKMLTGNAHDDTGSIDLITSPGGNIEILAGPSSNGMGADISIFAGTTSNNNGGFAAITTGSSKGAGSSGMVAIETSYFNSDTSGHSGNVFVHSGISSQLDSGKVLLSTHESAH